jgi:hypothetical protein
VKLPELIPKYHQQFGGGIVKVYNAGAVYIPVFFDFYDIV